MLEQLPDLAVSALSPINDTQYPWQRELEVSGFTCAEVGAALLHEWKLPAIIVEPIRYQHDPLNGSYFKQSGILHIALCFAGHFTRKSGEADLIAALDQQVLECLDVPVQWVEQQRTAFESQVKELTTIFI